MALLLSEVLDLKKRIDQTGFAARHLAFERTLNAKYSELIQLICHITNLKEIAEIDSLDKDTLLESEDIGILYNGLNMWFWDQVRANEALQLNEMLHNRLKGKPTLDSLAH